MTNVIKVYTSRGTVPIPNNAGTRETLKTILENEPGYKPGDYIAIVRDDGAPIVVYIDGSTNEVVLESIDSLDKEREKRLTNIFCFCRDRALIADSSHYGI